MTKSGAQLRTVPNSLLGHYAGPFSRLAAFLVDLLVSVGVYTIVLGLGSYLLQLLFDITLTGDVVETLRGLGLLAWLFIYFVYCWAAAGKTPGMALFGIRVVRGDGSDLKGGRAVIRMLVFPWCFAFFGAGFIGVIIGKHHRGLHDLAADTTVVYGWSARAARLRFLSRNRAPVPSAVGEARPAGSQAA